MWSMVGLQCLFSLVLFNHFEWVLGCNFFFNDKQSLNWWTAAALLVAYMKQPPHPKEKNTHQETRKQQKCAVFKRVVFLLPHTSYFKLGLLPAASVSRGLAYFPPFFPPCWFWGHLQLPSLLEATFTHPCCCLQSCLFIKAVLHSVCRTLQRPNPVVEGPENVKLKPSFCWGNCFWTDSWWADLVVVNFVLAVKSL